MLEPRQVGQTGTRRWKKYRRTNLAEMRPYVMGEDLSGISVSDPDQNHIAYCLDAGIDPAGMIARNPQNHDDQWYVSPSYFAENFAPIRDESGADT